MKLLFALLLPFAANAGTITVNWTAPTKNVDGTDIPTAASDPGALASYTLYYAVCTGSTMPPTVQTVQVAAPALTKALTLPPGHYCIQASATNVGGQTSSKTNVVTADVLPPVPLPPSGLTVSALTVYQALQAKDKFVMVPVGTVPGDTLCDVSQSANGYYAVPRDVVVFFGNVKPQLVFAKCA